MCKKGDIAEALLRGAAVQALGPPGALIPVPELGEDASAEEVAHRDSIVNHNKEVLAQNSQREGLVDDFVKRSLAASGETGASSGMRSYGDAVLEEFTKLQMKLGSDVGNLTLSQLYVKNPTDVREAITNLTKKIPELQGKSFDEAYALIPDAFKNRPLNEIVDMMPKNGMSGVTKSGAGGLSDKSLLIGVGVLGLVGALLLFTRRRE